MNPAIVITAVVVFLAVDAIIVYWAFRLIRVSTEKQKEHWQWLARHFGLTLEGGQPALPGIRWLAFITTPIVLEGQYRNHALRIRTQTVGSGGSSTAHLTAEISGPNPKGLTFECVRKGRLVMPPRARHLQELTTGDAMFDDLCRVAANDPGFMRPAFLPEIRGRIAALWKDWKTVGGVFRAEGDTVAFDRPGHLVDEMWRSQLADAVEILCDLRGIVMFYNRL